MPLYGYKCIHCDYTNEYLMKMEESDITLPCEVCSGDMKRVFGQIDNQLVKWTRRYVDENGKDSVVPSSAPGGSYKTSFRKPRNYGKGKKFVFDKVKGKMVQKK